METIYFKGNPCHITGPVPAVGEKAPDFKLVSPTLQEVKPEDFKGKRIVLNVFPSLDTGVCAMSVRRFNQEAADLDNTVVICASMDLPFAAGRFCSAEGINNVVAGSAFRSPEFIRNYGLQLVDGPLEGLLARAVIIIDENRNVIYRDIVEEITHEPDYEGAIDVLKATR
ncbi:MAG: thiol peroxidase [Muribaculaceae bacterium]|nr:thiol peroxidase [Muribaculaceae bacterium]